MASLAAGYAARSEIAERFAHLAPTCAVCNKLVDRMLCEHLMSEDVQVFVVECHGDRETTRIPAVVMLDRPKFSAGTAFATKRITVEAADG